jgi:hypothetical protein
VKMKEGKGVPEVDSEGNGLRNARCLKDQIGKKSRE